MRAGGAPARADDAPGGTLVGALTGEPDTLDPATSTIYTGAQVYDNIFSKLIDIDERRLVLRRARDRVEGARRHDVGVRPVPNATFHNGEPFTPDDVVYTFKRILDPATASAYAPLFDSIDTVTKSGDAQVTFTLKTPFGPFLTNLANNGQIVNQKAIEAGDPARNPVGTGPFKFVEWVQGQHVTLEKNADYFIEGKPSLDGVEFRFLLVDQSRIDGLRSGELDWVDAVPLQQLATLSTDAAFTYVTSPTAGHPRLPGDERHRRPVRQARGAPGRRLGARPHRHPRRRLLRRRRGRPRGGADRLDLVRRRRRLRRRTRHRAGARAARCRPGSPR